MSYSVALTALADPTRRSLYERLRRREQSVGELAKALRVSQPAVSQHLQVLRRARLVRERRAGTRHYYRAAPDGLAELRGYIESLWDDVLAAYADSTSEEA
jgi:DNA-binding transcriptional ArsR family regulator